MGYEIAGGLGAKLAAPDRDVFVMVGDGSYLMMAQELVTAVQERIKLIVVLVQNHGFASIGDLSETVGTSRFGTWYRYRNPATGRLDGDVLPVDLAASAQSLGVRVLRTDTIEGLRAALRQAKQAEEGHGPVLVHIETDPLVAAPGSESWWDVPVAEVSGLPATRQARQAYEAAKARQRPLTGLSAEPGEPGPAAGPGGHPPERPEGVALCQRQACLWEPPRTPGECGSPPTSTRCPTPGSWTNSPGPGTSGWNSGRTGTCRPARTSSLPNSPAATSRSQAAPCSVPCTGRRNGTRWSRPLARWPR
jgi:hypothetical protein